MRSDARSKEGVTVGEDKLRLPIASRGGDTERSQGRRCPATHRLGSLFPEHRSRDGAPLQLRSSPARCSDRSETSYPIDRLQRAPFGPSPLRRGGVSPSVVRHRQRLVVRPLHRHPRGSQRDPLLLPRGAGWRHHLHHRCPMFRLCEVHRQLGHHRGRCDGRDLRRMGSRARLPLELERPRPPHQLEAGFLASIRVANRLRRTSSMVSPARSSDAATSSPERRNVGRCSRVDRGSARDSGRLITET
jgi:hypothetical protein